MSGLEKIVQKTSDFLTNHPIASGIIFGTATALGVHYSFEIIDDFYQAYEINKTVLHENHLLDVFAGTFVGFNSYLKRTQLKTIKNLGLNFNKLKKKLKKVPRWEKKSFLEKSWTGNTAGISLAILVDAARKDFPDIDAYINSITQQPKEATVLAVQTIASAMLMSYIFKTAAPYIKKETRKNAFAKLELDFYELLKMNNTAKKRLEKYVENNKFSDLTLKYAHMCGKNKEYPKAFGLLLDSFDEQRSDIIQQNNSAIRTHTLRESLHRIGNDIEGHPNDFAAYFNLGMILGFLDENEDMCKVMDKFKQIIDKDEKLRLNGNLGYAVLLRKSDEKNKFIKLMTEVIKQNPEKVQPIGNSKTSKIKDNNFSNSTFTVRMDKNKTIILNDLKYNDELKTKFNELKEHYALHTHLKPNWKIIDTQDIVYVEPYYYGVTFFERGITLTEKMKMKYDETLMKEVMKFLSVLQSLRDNHGERRELEDLIEEFNKRLVSRKEKKLANINAIVNDNNFVLFDLMQYYHTVYDLDAHGDNWIIGPNIIKIDNQKRPWTVPFYDASKLALQGITYPNYEQRLDLIKTHYEKLKDIQQVYVGEYDEFKYHQLKSDVIKALSYFFFAYGDESRNENAKIFLQNSMSSMNELKKEMINKYQTTSLEYLNKAHEEALVSLR